MTRAVLVIEISELPINAVIMASFEADATFILSAIGGNYIPYKSTPQHLSLSGLFVQGASYLG